MVRRRALVAVCSFVAVVAVAAGAREPLPADDPDIAQVPATPAAQEPPVLLVDTGDLDAAIKRGTLRALTFGDDEPYLARDGAAPRTDVELAAAFAESLHLAFDPIRVHDYNELVPMLLAGKGDVIAARMTVTDARGKQIAFSRPTAVVSELLVGKAATGAPKTIGELAGKAVTVRASSSYQETLDGLHRPDLRVEKADESLDDGDLVQQVSVGKIAYTVVDSDAFANIAAYVPDVAALFPVREGRQIALGVRPANKKLLAALDAFLIEHAMTEHKEDASTGDLAAMKKRGSIRVILRNNATSYFLYRGVQQGFDYELLKEFARQNGMRIDVVVPREQSDVIPWLLAGKGDVIATEMAVTDARKAQIAFSQPYLFADEVLVQKKGDPPLKSLDALKGKTVFVRKTSSYRSTLDGIGGVDVKDAPEDQETEQLIAATARGEIPMTVADSTIASAEIRAHAGAVTTLVLKAHDPIGFGVRKENTALLAALDAYVKKHPDFERLKRKYFESDRANDAAHVDVRVTGRLSPYDDLIKKNSRAYGLDWRLMASQAYEESGFNPQAESWCGAVGLFQVMPHTGRELGFADVSSPTNNIHAGVMYMAELIDSWDPKLPFKQRVRFSLAAYNAGHGHVEDARELAASMGLDPNKWFGNVEKAMLRLEDPKVARKMKHGFCRGSEPVKYVSDIQSRYDNWTAVLGDSVK